jgi:hypothetical protein
MNIQTGLARFRSRFEEKTSKKGKNTEGVNKRTETGFKEISGDIWQNEEKLKDVVPMLTSRTNGANLIDK